MSSTPDRSRAGDERHLGLPAIIIGALIATYAVLTAWMALARYGSVHNRTFDLALYTRMAWGLAHGEAWDPIVGGSFLGGHVPFVLVPLGLLGRVVDLVPLLLITQSLAVACAAWPIARLGERYLGRAGGIAAALVWLLYPNLGHVATYEFHPGTFALFPLCCALDSFDRERPRALAFWCLAVVACRVSLALQTCVLGLLAAFAARPLRRCGRMIALVSIAYFVLWQVWLQPRFGQAAQTAADLHFGKWGGSPLGVLSALARAPASVLAHFAAPERLRYLVLVLAPLALLPLARPRLLLVALPPLALNLLSEFPTASTLYSHYLTPAVPALVVAALEGLRALLERSTRLRHMRALGLAALVLAALVGNLLAGGLPWSRDFIARDFVPDANTKTARKVIALIGRDASVQAPDALLPHLAERVLVSRVPPPERVTDFVVLDVSHRARFAREETLLRTSEEPLVRSWLARADHGLVFAERNLLVLRRGSAPRSGLVQHYFVGFAPPDSGRTLTDCLAVLRAELDGQRLTLQLVARRACPHDLALRFGTGDKPERVELLFDGLLSPAHLARGDLLRTSYSLGSLERRQIVFRGLNVGALRSSGARPLPSDPISVEVPLRVLR